MIDERFSAAAFAKLGRDTPSSKLLAEKLAAEIAAEMHRVAEAAFRDIAERLRALGHDLAPYDERQLSDDTRYYTYRDWGPGKSWDDHRLRIHLNLHAGAGFPHFVEWEKKKKPWECPEDVPPPPQAQP